ncbi:MAG: efflux RND transporter periplasmic adaptor subunit [Kiritimatiellia bacterium]
MSEELKREEIKKGTAAPPAWNRYAKPLLGGVVLIALILWSVGVGRTRMAGDKLARQPGLAVPPGAKILTVKAEPLEPRVDVVGTVASELRVNLSARIPAAVREVFVSAGSAVKKGQTLLTLDDRELREQAAAAEAQFKQAEAEVNRTRRLFESQAATEQALTAAQSLFAVARAQWDRSKVMLTYARVESPLDGVVTDRRVEPGDMANPGQVLLAVYDSANMQLEVPVPVRLLDKLPIGRAVEVSLDRSTRVYRGIVRQIVSEIDPLSRTQLVKARLEAPDGGLLPGTFGRLWVAEDAREAFLIPASAVYAVGQIELVQVVRDGRAIRRSVRTGPRTGGNVEVLSGLSSGDAVLLNPVKEN